ncbi:lytic murein transglycosylase [Pseudoroseicyclus tamaricis]|uniref:Lytic murein transglycosylase n=1 Tax=Pseudoroseicyclus tamaricis TaxID=2705421 RepID=A0A6B2K1T6_9RHOB|nr:lytic murein transglycosylase [Pseudoroseicyclus tamaricis]NDV02454.1 lytic murein transglycosylase [Pseudoroseicyclus tamaricis]
MRHLSILLALAGTPALAQTAPCGGDFESFKAGLVQEAPGYGVPAETAQAFLAGVSRDESVIAADRQQGVFQLDFVEFSRRLISQNRIDNGARFSSQYDATFDRIAQQYGVPRGILLAFWAFETDYGQVQGDFNTANALVTLAHDCRRPELFRPQVFAAMALYGRGDLDPATTTGAWAGEIGQVQMLPGDILENGVDGDGDGHVTLKTSAEDALMSGANVLRSLGWRPNEPWLQEVLVPETLDWAATGLDQPRPAAEWAAMGVQARTGQLSDLPASLLLPVGRRGPAFLAYPNFAVLFEWNESFVYVTTAAYFATRLEGAPVFANADAFKAGLTGQEMQALQGLLVERGYDVGGVDGILGEMTRAAVQAEQRRLGMPADAWPTRDLLDALE